MHVTHVIHSLGPGGAEQLLVDLAQVCTHGSFTMSVIGLTGSPDDVNAAALRALGVQVASLELPTRWDPRAFVAVRRTLRTHGADVVHTHLKHADIVGGVAARMLGLPQVSTLHVVEERGRGVAAFKRWLGAWVRERATARTLAVSDAQRAWYVESFPVDPARVVTLHNGVLDPAVRPATSADPDTADGVGRALGSATAGGADGAPAPVVAANVALMRPGKGHQDLLEAVRLLPEESPLRVLLVGDGAERPAIERAVDSEPRLASRVRLLGYRDDVPRLLEDVDLMVHPTHADALPTALIHALSQGVPIVATDVGGIPEIVNEEVGVLVPVGDPRRLAAALQELAEDPARRAALGRAGRKRFEEGSEARTWAGRLGEIYRETTTGSAPTRFARRGSVT